MSIHNRITQTILTARLNASEPPEKYSLEELENIAQQLPIELAYWMLTGEKLLDINMQEARK